MLKKRLMILLTNAVILLQEDYSVEEVIEFLGLTEKEYQEITDFLDN